MRISYTKQLPFASLLALQGHDPAIYGERRCHALGRVKVWMP